MLNHLGLFWGLAALAAVISYLLGSISFSILFTKLLSNNVDIRTLGSGNAGLTNVLRSVGLKAGIFTLVFDFLKGAASVLIGRALISQYCNVSGSPVYLIQYGALLAGLSCVIGHIYPLYFHFKGGKGVLSSSAVIAFCDWRLFCIVFIVFGLVFSISKIVSLSSIAAALSYPVASLLVTWRDLLKGAEFPLSYLWITTLFTATFAGLLVYKHRTNIQRLKNGTEKKFTLKRS